MDKRIKSGSVVQIDNNFDEPCFRGSLAIVRRCFDWGVEAIIAIPTSVYKHPNQAIVNIKAVNVHYIGESYLVSDDFERLVSMTRNIEHEKRKDHEES